MVLALAGSIWPVPAGSRVELRTGGTINYSGRYVEIDAAPAGAPLPEGATVPAGDTWIPVEFNQVFNSFGPHTRANLKRTLDQSGSALLTAGPSLASALDRSPGAVEEAASAIQELGSNTPALHLLATTAARVTDAAHRADPGVARLISGAAATFAATGQEATALRDTLAQAPAALHAAQLTLARANGTLHNVGDISDRIAPGVQAVRRIAAPLDTTLQTLVRVGPLASATLTTARTAAPDLTALLERAKPDLPEITNIGKVGAKQVDCIRPYAPELAGFAGTWAGFVSQGDGMDKFARVYVQTYGLPTATPVTAGQASTALPYLSYAFPRPAGLNAGKPWFRPQCGSGPDSLSPSMDPEARNFDPFSRSLLRIDPGTPR
jgi:ABC-type transporter Mla subunit MlaD